MSEAHTERRLGIIMCGVTGRMGTNQHLERSIAAIRADGGLRLQDGNWLVPDPILVGRNEMKLRALASRYDIAHFTTDLSAALADAHYEVFFDASSTAVRVDLVKQPLPATSAFRPFRTWSEIGAARIGSE